MRSITRLLRGQAIAILALLLALSGTAYSATVAAKNSVVSKSIKNGNVKTADLKTGAVTADKVAPGSLTGAQVQDGSLTGADVDEGSLGRVPSAVAAQAGGLVFPSTTGSCTPATTTAFEPCVVLTFTLPVAARLVLVGQAGISHRTDNQYEAIGYCQYQVNGVAGGTTAIARNAGNLATGWTDLAPLIFTSPVVPAGAVTVGIWCEDNYYSKFTDVKFVAMAASS